MGEISDEEKKTLGDIYYNLKNPASYSTVEKLYESVNRRIPKQKILKWLQGQLSHTLHRQKRINFKRNHYNVYSINELWQADLMDLPSLADHNDGYKFILLIIDCFSRFIWTRPLKSKTSSEV
jgi:transposase InsO family protein